MTNLIRSAKPATKWTTRDLLAYNIHLVQEDQATFFGRKDLPLPQVDPELLHVEDHMKMAVLPNRRLIHHVKFVMMKEKSAMLPFLINLVDVVGYYTTGNRIPCTRNKIPLVVCGERKCPIADFCLWDDTQKSIDLLFQEDKDFWRSKAGAKEQYCPEARLVVKAVGVFFNNNRRLLEAGKPELNTKVIPGIVMKGTIPTFFKIPVTTQLVTAIRDGQYRTTPTHVGFHIPEMPRPSQCWTEGMKPLDNREHLLKCYEAFKDIVDA